MVSIYEFLMDETKSMTTYAALVAVSRSMLHLPLYVNIDELKTQNKL